MFSCTEGRENESEPAKITIEEEVIPEENISSVENMEKGDENNIIEEDNQIITTTQIKEKIKREDVKEEEKKKKRRTTNLMT